MNKPLLKISIKKAALLWLVVIFLFYIIHLFPSFYPNKDCLDYSSQNKFDGTINSMDSIFHENNIAIKNFHLSRALTQVTPLSKECFRESLMLIFNQMLPDSNCEEKNVLFEAACNELLVTGGLFDQTLIDFSFLPNPSSLYPPSWWNDSTFEFIKHPTTLKPDQGGQKIRAIIDFNVLYYLKEKSTTSTIKSPLLTYKSNKITPKGELNIDFRPSQFNELNFSQIIEAREWSGAFIMEISIVDLTNDNLVAIEYTKAIPAIFKVSGE